MPPGVLLIHSRSPLMSMIDIHSDQMVDMAFIVRFTGMTDKWFYKLILGGTVKEG